MLVHQLTAMAGWHRIMTIASSGLAPIDRSLPARPQVYEALREAIVSVRLPPGQVLSEKELALRLGVSRTPVREAVIRLSEEGLVEVYPQARTVVAPVRIAEVLQARFFREALECTAIRRAARRIQAADIRRLGEMLKEQKRLWQREDYDAVLQADEVFHQTIVDAAGFSRVWRTVREARAHLDRVRTLGLPALRNFGDQIIPQHAAVVEALQRRDPDAAALAMQRHLRNVFTVLAPLRVRFPEYFADEAGALEEEMSFEADGLGPASPGG